MSTSSSNDGRSCSFYTSSISTYSSHGGRSWSSEQGFNTCAYNLFLSKKNPMDENQHEDDIHHEDTYEKINHYEDDEFEEHTDDDNRYEDDDSEEDSSLVECDGKSYLVIKSSGTHQADLVQTSKQEPRTPFEKFKIIWQQLRDHFSKTPQVLSIKCIYVGSENIIFRSNNTIDPNSMYWISTDGYYRKEGPTAGYGAIVRDGAGNPIVACSGISTPSSLLYHQLEGVRASLELAKKKGIRKIVMCCNSERTREVTIRFLDEDLHCPHGFGDDKNVICMACVKVFFLHTQIDHASLFPLLNNIRELSFGFEYSFQINAVGRRLNRAADYLAKHIKNAEFEAPEFPIDLQKILLEDARGRSLNGLPFSSQGFCFRKRGSECTGENKNVEIVVLH
ncbi:hypothetical protein C5167_048118 [Papaver somniferum]|uniref:Uncharacterized protein n=1 Tax=Papaver somniferum TaxID=3469 RepID=A0A4Y7KL08_PAPSO|nr:uncharacterized protein LOC113304990 [Papaver somniferum]RZC72639.1 hypothetical protein C5167_048118 [Papaver somniferum]